MNPRHFIVYRRITADHRTICGHVLEENPKAAFRYFVRVAHRCASVAEFVRIQKDQGLSIWYEVSDERNKEKYCLIEEEGSEHGTEEEGKTKTDGGRTQSSRPPKGAPSKAWEEDLA